MKLLIFCICCWPLISNAQENNKGIRWVEGFNWEQVKAMAKKENKYIFLDCYATWCGPCKKMDKEVYPVDSVGDYYNLRFIAVKVQMDITKNDPSTVQAWYNDAQQIAKQFRIDSYPTFLYFSPDGVLVNKVIGYAGPRSILAMARRALTPGLVYVDPIDHFNRLMDGYPLRKVRGDSLLYLLNLARQVGDMEKEKSLSGDLYKYLSNLPSDSLFTREWLGYISSVTKRSTDRWFSIFLKQSKKVNKIMKDAYFSQRIVDRAILEEVAFPFLKANRTAMWDAMRMMATGMKADLAEADWPGLEREIQKHYSAHHAKRNTLAARFIWYKQHWNIPSFAKAYLEYLDRYGVDAIEWTDEGYINDILYANVFVSISDGQLLEKSIRWMKAVVAKYPFSNYLDTYASLLYKAGRKKEALYWEKQALEKVKNAESATAKILFYQSVIGKMERGEKLNWEN